MHQTSQKPRYSVANFLIYIMAPAFSQIAHLVFRKSSIHKTSKDRTALAVTSISFQEWRKKNLFWAFQGHLICQQSASAKSTQISAPWPITFRN